MPEPRVDEERLRLAEAFLQEVTYRSRETQAAPFAAGGSLDRTCGLGERATVDLDLSPPARALLADLWSHPLPPAALDHVQTVLTTWIERVDALDRKRNHFLKAFRHSHGFDRTRYSPTDLATYDSSLESINAEIRLLRRESATQLLALP